MNGTHCKWCRAQIEWAVNEATGHRIPLDAGASSDGNIVRTGKVQYDGAPFVRVYANPELAMAAGLEARRFTNHLARCTQKKGRRRRG